MKKARRYLRDGEADPRRSDEIDPSYLARRTRRSPWGPRENGAVRARNRG